MNISRRTFLKLSGRVGALAGAVAIGLVSSGRALAAGWNKAGFESKALADVMKSLGVTGATESKDIIITAPDIAEN